MLSQAPTRTPPPSTDGSTTTSPDIPMSVLDDDEFSQADVTDALLPRWKAPPKEDRSGQWLVRLAELRYQLIGLVAIVAGATLVFVLDGKFTSTLSASITDRLSSLGYDSDPALAPSAASSASLFTNSSTAPTTPALSATQLWLLNQTDDSNTGVVPFSPSMYSAVLPFRPLEAPSTVLAEPGCAEAWVARGELCAALSGRWARAADKPQLDVVWTWVNGSEHEFLTEWRERVSQEVGEGALQTVEKRSAGGSVAKHFRDHDELRFSMRSVVSALPAGALRKLHLLVGDAAAGAGRASADVSSTELRLAQVPHWLSLPRAVFARPSQNVRASPSSPMQASAELQIVPHSSIFKTADRAGPMDDAAREEEAARWRTDVVPSFNSLAIESQTANIGDLGEGFVGMNDDFFMLKSMTTSDFYSPLTGPVFRFQRDLMVAGKSPTDRLDDGDGEWRGLSFANHLLDCRFGQRPRPYLVHQAKAGSGPLFREMQRVWAAELTQSAQARFRGKQYLEAQTWFLFTHYVIEKHREALLWSWAVARADADHDGFLSVAERRAMLAELGLEAGGDEIEVRAGVRDSMSSLEDHIEQAGLDRPAETNFVFSSADGYAHFRTAHQLRTNEFRPWPAFKPGTEPDDPEDLHTCTLNIAQCFGPGFASSSVFADAAGEGVNAYSASKRLAFEHPGCGDCVIVALLKKSGKRGLEAFLPPKATAARPEVDPHSVPAAVAVGLGASAWEDANFAGPPLSAGLARLTAIRLISRYAYVIGETDSRFVSNKGLEGMLKTMLNSVDDDKPTFLALNDDISPFMRADLVEKSDAVAKDWFRSRWPDKTRWEI